MHPLIAVRVGTSYYRVGGKLVRVKHIYYHPSYDEETLQDNLVIMKLERHLNFKRKTKRRRVRHIDINTDVGEMPEGTEVVIAGWGAKLVHNKVYNALWNKIHKAVLTVSSWDECVDTYTENYVRTTNFCAQNKRHEGACDRDGGNPAVADGLLMGVVSFGAPNCGQRDAPTVFTNIGYYAEWIQRVMNKVESSESSSYEKKEPK
ncbi:chymotrypsin-2-like [Leguminivora glycinivorella]|uniref:chymotrypsin-2-like n=1 Tax=Leguminivora glycinivorella TaxID=1035111 RepID=UPI00200E59B4|nr:chymotrypsin-2-like [Leguminivora glycinivorella]